MTPDTDLLIIGAGPFGLSLAAQVDHDRVDHLVVGKPMGFWSAHMPGGMYLRSECDWHVDPLEVDTIEAYLESMGRTPAEVLPLSLSFYLDYARWFQRQKGIEPLDVRVRRLERRGDRFVAELENGETVTAGKVALALGFEYFLHIPAELAEMVPPGRSSHTCNAVDLARFKGRRVLIVGGRQSAFEWAALLLEQGATAVDITHRHDSPAFAVADWSWVNPLLRSMIDDPGWYRRLPSGEQQAIIRRMWGEGRLKVEPWLAERLRGDAVRIWPRTQLVACREWTDGNLEVRLDNGQSLSVDHVIFATGYRVDLSRIPLLEQGNLRGAIETRDGFPVLDEHFQTSVPGLFITSLAAGQDFGPFFGFTGAVRTSARLIAAGLTA